MTSPQTLPNPINALSLFSGIGGLDHGLEQAGITTIGQVELNPWCRQILHKHWPDVPKHDDVQTTVEWWQSQPRPSVHIIAGGFPCQDISNAGTRKGITGERSSLWKAMHHNIAALQPDYAIIENVAALTSRGLDTVLEDLADIGFDADWQVVSACSVGAPHVRKRLFIVAYPARIGWERRRGIGADAPALELEGCGSEQGGAWPTRPEGVGVAYGVPGRVDRLRGLGNAVVPAVAALVGRVVVADIRGREGSLSRIA